MSHSQLHCVKMLYEILTGHRNCRSRLPSSPWSFRPRGTRAHRWRMTPAWLGLPAGRCS